MLGLPQCMYGMNMHISVYRCVCIETFGCSQSFMLDWLQNWNSIEEVCFLVGEKGLDI